MSDVAWSVCLSVGHMDELKAVQMAEPIGKLLRDGDDRVNSSEFAATPGDKTRLCGICQITSNACFICILFSNGHLNCNFVS